jgi:AcrR family transcriptional regulator
MTDLLHLPAQPDAPIACDMSTAQDTPDERLREYGRLFERALLRRQRTAHALVLSFRAAPDTREEVNDLARREAACCPFADYRVETVGDEVTYTITNTITGERRAGVDVMLDAFYTLPDHAGSDFAGSLDRLADNGAPSPTNAPSPTVQRGSLRQRGQPSLYTRSGR